MSRFAKLPLALLAVLAMLFLMPGLARADDAAPPPDACAVDPAPAGCPAPAAGTDAGPAAAVPNAVTDVLPPCTDLEHVTDCVIPCTVEPFKSSPLCPTTTPPPPGPCEKLTDLPLCIPDCAFLAEVLHQNICTTLPQCLDPTILPPDFPAIPGVPVCQPTTAPPPPSTSPTGVYYKNCADARAHGKSNIHRGQPGYRPGLDRDNDGIACESSTPTGTTKTPQPAKAPAPQTTAAPVADQLAYTGAVPAPMTAAGIGLVLGGAALLRLSRRPPTRVR